MQGLEFDRRAGSALNLARQHRVHRLPHPGLARVPFGPGRQRRLSHPPRARGLISALGRFISRSHFLRGADRLVLVNRRVLRLGCIVIGIAGIGLCGHRLESFPRRLGYRRNMRRAALGQPGLGQNPRHPRQRQIERLVKIPLTLSLSKRA